MKTPEQTLSSNLGLLNPEYKNPEFQVYMEWDYEEDRGVLEYTSIVNGQFLMSTRQEGIGVYGPSYKNAERIIFNLNKYGPVTTYEYFPDGTLEEKKYNKGEFKLADAQES